MPEGMDMPLMEGLFMACVSATVKEPGAVERFEKDTGYRLVAIARTPMDKLIDKACGRDSQAEIMARFCDWVVERVWGEEGACETPDDPE